MLFHSVMLFVLSGSLAPGSAPGEPRWLMDYDSAQKQGMSEKKPLAVVIGSGMQGWERLDKEGNLGKEAKTLLADNYVCVYVDTDQAAGKRLASSFDVENQGLVISDREGTLQAFRHEGNLSDEKLTHYLRRFADPDLVVQTTVTNPDDTEKQAVVVRNDPATVFAPSVTPSFTPSFFGGACRT